MKRRLIALIAILLIAVMSLTSCDTIIEIAWDILKDGYEEPSIPSVSLDTIPEFDGENAYVIINENKPFFTEEEITTESFEEYGKLDRLGRCTVTIACVGFELMPTEDRESISNVTPTGYVQKEYGDIVPGGYLYNRCHLIGFQLTGENANKQNLIAGTRFLNIEGMLPFEDMVADYIREHPSKHVMYRVTPIFEGDNLLASGVLMEAYSVEDNGVAICFCIYAYNCQPGIEIDYLSGESSLAR